MKKAILMVLVLSGLFASAAHAEKDSLYIIDFSGKRFADNTFNLMDDGISGDFDGYGIKVSGKFDEDFTVVGHASNPAEQCAAVPFKVTGKFTILRLIDDLETDAGGTCDITVIYRDGRKATLQIFEEGT